MGCYLTGLDRLCSWLAGEAPALLLGGVEETLRCGRLGLVTHPAAVDRDLRPATEALPAAGARLAALFGPEHGIRGQAAAGEDVASHIDVETGLPVYSLYGETRRPTPQMLHGLDAVVVDLQDVGTRFYTYAATLSLVMEAAAEQELPVVVLDRANPIGGRVTEGPLLDPAFASFVGPHPVPIRHGLTLGELALLFHREYGVGAAPHVVPVAGWSRQPWPQERPWVPPSPNIPTVDAALLYPGVGLLEGTNLSEGRGTAKPFEWVGAPWVSSPRRWRDALEALKLPGVRFREISFVPATSKHAGQVCAGLHVHLLDRNAARPVTVGAALLWTAHQLWPRQFVWLEVGGRYKIDRLAGGDRLRRAIDDGVPLAEILQEWREGLARFETLRGCVMLYR